MQRGLLALPSMNRLWLVAMLVSACTITPKSAPKGDPLPAECTECLSADDASSGCGAEERACSGIPACDEALLCVLRFECWSRHEGPDCPDRHGCSDVTGAAAEALAEFEACARARCAESCDFGAN
jgi:hypothetical protein